MPQRTQQGKQRWHEPPEKEMRKSIGFWYNIYMYNRGTLFKLPARYVYTLPLFIIFFFIFFPIFFFLIVVVGGGSKLATPFRSSLWKLGPFDEVESISLFWDRTPPSLPPHLSTHTLTHTHYTLGTKNTKIKGTELLRLPLLLHFSYWRNQRP